MSTRMPSPRGKHPEQTMKHASSFAPQPGEQLCDEDRRIHPEDASGLIALGEVVEEHTKRRALRRAGTASFRLHSVRRDRGHPGPETLGVNGLASQFSLPILTRVMRDVTITAVLFLRHQSQALDRLTASGAAPADVARCAVSASAAKAAVATGRHITADDATARRAAAGESLFYLLSHRNRLATRSARHQSHAGSTPSNTLRFHSVGRKRSRNA